MTLFRFFIPTALFLAALIACNNIEGPNTSPPPSPDAPNGIVPIIESFTATPPAIVPAGEPVTLAWTIEGEVDSLVITADFGESPGEVSSSSTSIVVSPTNTITYTLTATNSAGSDDASVSVGVGAPNDPPGEQD